MFPEGIKPFRVDIPNISTDQLTRVTDVLHTDPESIRRSLLLGLSPETNSQITAGDWNILFAGSSFGIGSSRENSAEAIARNGFRVAAAESFGPIFRANLINQGVIPVTNEAARLRLENGENLDFDTLTSELPEGEKTILVYGGLPGYLTAIARGIEELPQKFIPERKAFPQTTVEKIISRLATQLLRQTYPDEADRCLQAGDTVILRPDLFVGYDVFWVHVQRVLAQHFDSKTNVDPRKIWLSWDHFRDSTDSRAVTAVKLVQDFWQDHPDTFIGNDGVYNQVIPRHLKPGSVIAAMDSHSDEFGKVPGVFNIPEGYTPFACALATGGLTPYTIPESIQLNIIGKLPSHTDIKDAIFNMIMRHFSEKAGDGAMFEIGGTGYQKLSYEEASKVFNAVTEFGGIGAIGIDPNPNVIDYLRRHGTGLNGWTDEDLERLFSRLLPETGASYRQSLTVNLADTIPVIVGPHTHKRVIPLDQLSEAIFFNRIIINSCGGSSLLDLAILAEVLNESSPVIHIDIQIADPLTRIYAERLGIITALREKDEWVRLADSHTCGPCLGSGAAVQEGEIVLSTNNRNYRTRMGHPNSEVYLASSVVAAVTATLGRAPTDQEIRQYESAILRAKAEVKAAMQQGLVLAG